MINRMHSTEPSLYFCSVVVVVVCDVCAAFYCPRNKHETIKLKLSTRKENHYLFSLFSKMHDMRVHAHAQV